MSIFVPPGALSCALLAGLAALAAYIPQAPGQQTDADDAVADDIETLVVTGSYIRRTDEGALPVTVITQEDIERTGATTTEQLLQNVSAAVQGNNNVVAATAAGFNSASVSGASLRGLGSQRTLVLINGRRSPAGGTLTDSTTVDINSIPLAAVERVEVLKDGASAIYGSDAIAGVINFILRRDYTGSELRVYYGDTVDGGAKSKQAHLTLGFGEMERNNFNLLFSANYQEDEPLFGRQRDFARTGINVAALNDTSSGNTFPANIVIPVIGANGVASSVTGNPNYPTCNPSVVSPLFEPFGPPGVCRYDPSSLVSLLPGGERTHLFSSARVGLGENLQVYAEAGFTHKRSNVVIQGSPVSDQFGLPPTHPLTNQPPYNAGTPGVGFATIVLSPSSPYYPTSYIQGITGGATPDVLVRYRTVNIGDRDFTDIADTTRGVLGLQGVLAGWTFDLPFLYAKTKLTERINGGISLYTRLLPLLNSGQVNFFGENTPIVQSQLQATQFIGEAYSADVSLMSLAPNVSRELMDLPAGPLAVAFGAELREEKFQTEIAPELQIGDTTQYGGSNLPVDESRYVTSAFAEVSIPIVGTLSTDLALRFDDYENTGNKTTPKIGLRWQPADPVLLRASYGRGFRAPSLSELHQPQITGVSAPGLNDPARCQQTDANGVVNTDSRDCLTQFNILLGGNTELSPEESDNYTLGVVFEPWAGMSASLDLFRVKLENTIIFGVDPNAILANADRFADFITRGPADPATPGLPGHILQINQTNLNFGETKVTGLDVDLRWRLPETAVGRFTIGMSGTYFDEYEVQNLDGTFTSVAGKVSFVVNGAGGAIPRWRHYLTLTWAVRDLEVTLAQNFQNGYEDIPGTFEDPADPAFTPRDVGSYLTYDLQASFNGGKRFRPTLGIRNVFNRDPPYTNAGGTNFFQGGYDPGYADPRGRFIYASVSYSFE